MHNPVKYIDGDRDRETERERQVYTHVYLTICGENGYRLIIKPPIFQFFYHNHNPTSRLMASKVSCNFSWAIVLYICMVKNLSHC